MNIGETIRNFRLHRGMSQGDIEKRTGLLRCYLSRVENGHTIPSLDTLAKITQETGPQAINHYGQLPAVTISFNLRPGVSLSEAVDSVERMARLAAPAQDNSPIRVDAGVIQQALLNLALNACQAMPNGGTLEIRGEAARNRRVAASSRCFCEPEWLCSSCSKR